MVKLPIRPAALRIPAVLVLLLAVCAFFVPAAQRASADPNPVACAAGIGIDIHAEFQGTTDFAGTAAVGSVIDHTVVVSLTADQCHVADGVVRLTLEDGTVTTLDPALSLASGATKTYTDVGAYTVDAADIGTNGAPAGFVRASADVTASSHRADGVNQTVRADADWDVLVVAPLSLHKVDTQGNPQSGVVLRVTGPDEATTAFECTTDDSGQCVIEDLAPGSYDVSEPTPPDGFALLACEPDPVAVTAAGPNDVTCTNQLITGDLTLHKVDATGTPQEGVTLQVVGADGATFECTTDTSGTCVIRGLVPGTYSVNEPMPPPGYEFAGCDPNPIDVTGAGPNEVTCTNRLITANLVLRKVDTAGAPQEGVTLQIVGADGVVHECTTDAGGTCVVEGLVPGSYDVAEPTPPAGYELVGCDPDPVDVTAAGPNTVTCTNRLITGNLTVHKVDTAGTPQEGVTLQIVGADGVVHECTTDAGGTCVIEGLVPGSYDVNEPTPPAGFELVGCDPDPVDVTAAGPNTVTCTNRPVTMDLILRKVDTAGNPLEGVILQVTGPDGTTYECTTDASGTCVISGLAPGTYDVSEPSPPDGFHLIGCEPDPITLAAGGTNTVTCTNERIVVTQQGCTPGYWKQDQHFDSWVTFSPDQALESVFDVPDDLNMDGTTFLQALQGGGGPGVGGAAKILLRAAVASLLNSASGDVGFPMTTADIIADVNAALASGDRQTMLDLAGELDAANNLGCPLS